MSPVMNSARHGMGGTVRISTSSDRNSSSATLPRSILAMPDRLCVNHKKIGPQSLHGAGNHLERRAFLDAHGVRVIAEAGRVQERDQLLGRPESFPRNVLIDVGLADASKGQLSLRQREERMDKREPGSPEHSQSHAGLDGVCGWLRPIDRRQGHSVGLRHLSVHHQHRVRSGPDHALEGRSDKNIAQELFAVRPHDDKVRLNRRCRSQDTVEGIPGNNHRTAADAAELGHCADLLGEDAVGLACLDRDQIRRLIIVDNMDESELGAACLRQQARSPQRPLRSDREIGRCENLHEFVS
jgi:hypothetical protein